MEITEVRVRLMKNRSDKLQAFCSITIDNQFVIRDLKVIEGGSGPFVAMPSRKLTDRCPKCGSKNPLRSNFCSECGAKLNASRTVKDGSGKLKYHADVAHPINSECRESIQKKVLEAFAEEVERSKRDDYVPAGYDDLEEFEDLVDEVVPEEDISRFERRVDKEPAEAPRIGGSTSPPRRAGLPLDEDDFARIDDDFDAIEKTRPAPQPKGTSVPYAAQYDSDFEVVHPGDRGREPELGRRPRDQQQRPERDHRRGGRDERQPERGRDQGERRSERERGRERAEPGRGRDERQPERGRDQGERRLERERGRERAEPRREQPEESRPRPEPKPEPRYEQLQPRREEAQRTAPEPKEKKETDDGDFACGIF